MIIDDGHTYVLTLSLQHSYLVTLKRKKRSFEIIRLFLNKIIPNLVKDTNKKRWLSSIAKFSGDKMRKTSFLFKIFKITNNRIVKPKYANTTMQSPSVGFSIFWVLFAVILCIKKWKFVTLFTLTSFISKRLERLKPQGEGRFESWNGNRHSNQSGSSVPIVEPFLNGSMLLPRNQGTSANRFCLARSVFLSLRRTMSKKWYARRFGEICTLRQYVLLSICP